MFKKYIQNVITPNLTKHFVQVKTIKKCFLIFWPIFFKFVVFKKLYKNKLSKNDQNLNKRHKSRFSFCFILKFNLILKHFITTL